MGRLLPVLIFPLDPLTERTVESAFEAEYRAAVAAGFHCRFWDGRDQLRRDISSPLTENESSTRMLYRGWMLSRDGYGRLAAAADSVGMTMITSGEQYARCHYFPGWYPVVELESVPSIWIEADGAIDFSTVHAAVGAFGDRPIIVKDYVKSQKHYWQEACFIPSASSKADVERVVTRFVELQDGELNGGLVFREYVELAALGTHSKSGMPISLEYRAFLLNGRLATLDPYWDADIASGDVPDRGWLESIANRIDSPFITIDVARRVDGRWVVMEVGDGQVSGLPDRCLPGRFYESIARGWS